MSNPWTRHRHADLSLGVLNSTRRNQAVCAFRHHEDASLSCTGVRSDKRLRFYGFAGAVIAVDDHNQEDVSL